jgi:L-ribulose-5-phosphate 3-epimerase
VHFSDTGQQVYRHDPVGAGNVPFAEVPPVLEEIGYKRLPMLEIIAPDAEKGILASADKLAAMGYGRA